MKFSKEVNKTWILLRNIHISAIPSNSTVKSIDKK